MKAKKGKKHLKDGSKHVLNYINKGNNHCSWDYIFLFGILEAKLHDMEDFFSSDEKTHLSNWKQVHKQIKLVRAVLNVYINDDGDKNQYFRFNTKNIDDDLKYRYNQITTNDRLKNSELHYSFLYDVYRTKALRLALRLIGQYGETWWD